MTLTVRRGLLLLCSVLLTACGSQPRVIERWNVCPDIPAGLTRDCGTCQAGEPAPRTNGELAEAWFECRACAAEYRARTAAIKTLAECRRGTTGAAAGAAPDGTRGKGKGSPR